MAFTYNQDALGQATAAGRLATVRLLLTDAVNTDDQPAIFTDAEINAFLTLAQSDVWEAAAIGYETWARSRGRLAVRIATSTIKSDRHHINELMAAAANLRQARLRTLATGDISSGVMAYLDESRPAWRDINGTNEPVE